MSKLKNVTGNMMIKNEEKYIRQTIRSVAPYLERLIIVDTGSTDKTLEYVTELMKEFPQIELFKENVTGDSIHWTGNHLSQQLTDVRNQMIKLSKTPWIMQIDGDEIYPKETIDRLINIMDKLDIETGLRWVVGIMIKIKWCTSPSEFVEPGPFDRTLRIFKNGGTWVGKFPDEFLYIDNQPIHILDRRCITVDKPFLHMSMDLHAERRPSNGELTPLSLDEIEILRIK